MLVLVLGGAALQPPPARASDINDNPECQRQFEQLARPYFQRMLWFASQGDNYPLTANARPVVTGWPYSASGPGNGYGPGSPYGPNFGTWGAGSFGPGFGGPGGYGYGPNGVGGPAWQFAGAAGAASAVDVSQFPPGLSGLATANQVAALPGGIAALGPGDLMSLSGLREGVIGTAFGGGGLQQVIIANRIGEASLRQSVIGNRLSAAGLNHDLASFPYDQANNLYNIIAGIQAYVGTTCPRAVPEDPGPAATQP
jgi:hypothetical protein